METEFNTQESEFQETSNHLGNEESQLDGGGSWDEEVLIDVDQLEDNEEADDHNPNDTEVSTDDAESNNYDKTEIQDGDDNDESDLQKNTPDENSNRVLSFEDYFKN
jgi:hypothetical protein